MLNNFQSPGDIAFSLFGFPVYYYGIILAFATFVGFYIAYLLYKKFYGNAELILDMSPWLVIFGILGARIYYCLVNYSHYLTHPAEIFYIRGGGLSVHGMLIAGFIALMFFSKKYKVSFFKITDIFLCGTALSQSIGRWGNFFNSEAFGLPCDLPWKLYISPSHRPIEYLNYEYFHPTFLYESILNLVMFFVLLLLFKKYSDKSGVITGLYLVLYSVIRFLVEGFRIDSSLDIFGVPVAQIMSVLLFIFGCGLLIWKLRQPAI